jgi:hypothetical protein
MRRKISIFLVFILLIACMLAASGCSGKLNMLTGQWRLVTAGDGYGNNQQAYPLPVTIDIYPDGRVDMLESRIGTWTMDRDSFSFVGSDVFADQNYTGTFKIDTTTNADGNKVLALTIFLGDRPESYVLQKLADYAQMLALSKAQQTAAPAGK